MLNYRVYGLENPKYYWLIFFFCAVYSLNLSAQTDSFDSTYVYVATELSFNHIDKAIASADSLYNIAKTEEQKIKSVMLLATLKDKTGDIESAISDALLAEQLSLKSKNKEWQIRIFGFLATTFRKIGVNEKAKEYIIKAEKLNNKLHLLLFEMYINQEKAFYALNQKEYSDVLMLVDKAETINAKYNDKPRFHFNQAVNNYLKGSAYLSILEKDSARIYFTKALSGYEDKESEEVGFIYQQLGQLYLESEKLDSSIYYLKLSESIANKSNNFGLKLDTYQSLVDYYKYVNSAEDYMIYEYEFSKLRKNQTELFEKFSNIIIRDLGKGKQVHKRLFLSSIVVISILITVLLFYYFYNRRKARLREIQFKEVLHRLNEFNSLKSEKENGSKLNKELAKNKMDEEDGHENELGIIQETVDKILMGLNKFEINNEFLNPDVSLSSVATYLGTNIKYLSNIIRVYKGSDFNNYINELRIRYIVTKLHNDPEYQGYKIAYLAQECGYSSHSKFSSVFKIHTMMTPSEFIAQLKKNNSILS